eukprot:TRINITY_DN17622_c0_g1_i1.p1 TRINITY_DN17622_c0_g1~~TRINITY_DN17622_c0_g1_i1.p1  ORF type:complete len:308 (+),score=78.09 TRINITY_DN17622_c0_g1_i1:1130-2053(+)
MFTSEDPLHRHEDDTTFTRDMLSIQYANIRGEIHARIASYLYASCIRPASDSPTNALHPTMFDDIDVHRTLEDMLHLVRAYHVTSDEAILLAVILMQRYMVARSIFLTTRNVRSLFLVSLMLAQKSIEDIPHNNTTFANLGEISSQDINILEIDFLASVHFRLRCQPDKIVRMMNAFVEDVSLQQTQQIHPQPSLSCPCSTLSGSSSNSTSASASASLSPQSCGTLSKPPSRQSQSMTSNTSMSTAIAPMQATISCHKSCRPHSRSVSPSSWSLPKCDRNHSKHTSNPRFIRGQTPTKICLDINLAA